MLALFAHRQLFDSMTCFVSSAPPFLVARITSSTSFLLIIVGAFLAFSSAVISPLRGQESPQETQAGDTKTTGTGVQNADSQNTETPESPPSSGPPKSVYGLNWSPIVEYDSEHALRYGFRLFLKQHALGYQPHRSLLDTQYSTSSSGYTKHLVSYNFVPFKKSSHNWDLSLVYENDPLANYYGYGNTQNIRRILQITGDQDPIIKVGANRYSCVPPNCPTDEELRTSQNRYYNYLYRLYATQFIGEQSLPASHWSYQYGFRLREYALDSYYNTVEASEADNVLSLLDKHMPYGYAETIATDSRAQVFLANLAFAYDTRPKNRLANPDNGIFSDIYLEQALELGMAKYNYTQFSWTWRHYVSLFPKLWSKLKMESIFAYRLLAHQTLSGQVPFFERGRIRSFREEVHGLGGKNGLRAYPRFQFVDRFTSLLNLELRHNFLDLKLLGGTSLQLIYFRDYGRVAPSFAKWSTQDQHFAQGLGLAAVWQNYASFQFLWGRSKYYHYLSFTGQHSF